jgi:peptidoglycan/LPS O-acetylase OafA/YrhL
VAILSVMLRHFGLAYPANTAVERAVATTLHFGWAGVDLFFVLSGFLITGILIDTRPATNYFSSFWARRALRIIPVYVVFLSIWFVVLPPLAARLGLHADLGTAHWLPYWTWTANLFGVVPQLGHLWSLSVEEQFYLLWPLIVWRLPNRSLAVLCVGLAVICPIIRAIPLLTAVDPVWPWRIFARSDSLALGALVSLIVRDDGWRQVAMRWWRPALAVTSVAIGATLVALGDVDLQSSTQPLSAVGLSFIDLACMAMLTGTVLTAPTASGFRWLDGKGLRTLGKYSYSLYLVHGPLAHISMHALPATRWWRWFQFQSVYLGFMAALIALSFGAAWASWHVLEQRCLALKDRFEARFAVAGTGRLASAPQEV